MLNFLRNLQTDRILRGLLLFSFPIKTGESSSCFTSLPVIFCLFVCFSFRHISRCVMVSHCSFNLDFAINDVGYLFICLFAIYVIFDEVIVHIFCPYILFFLIFNFILEYG